MAASISVWMPVSWWSLSPYISCLTNVPANHPASYNRCIHAPLSGPIHRKLSKCWKSMEISSTRCASWFPGCRIWFQSPFDKIWKNSQPATVGAGCVFRLKFWMCDLPSFTATPTQLHLAVLIQLLQRNMFIYTGQSIKYQYLLLCCQFKSLISYESWITPQQDIG